MSRKAAEEFIGRRRFLAATGSATAGMCFSHLAWCSTERAFPADRPNIVVILSDDQGYADASCYDHAKEVDTPNIDRLAKEGVRLTNGYTSGSVCAPTRAGLLTGRYQQRFEFYDNPDGERGVFRNEITIAQLLKNAGYVTGIVGKWHLGTQPENHPNRKGFDEFCGFLGGGHDYFDLDDAGNPIYRNGKVVHGETGYLTDVLSREAAAFIERHRGEPFFLYLAYNAVHKPPQAPAQYLERFNTGDKVRDNYLARLLALDNGIGRVLDAFKEARVEENTLVFFLSDNGGTSAGADNGVLRSGKGEVYEGGIRVPFLVRWPRRLPGGQVCSTPVVSMDILPSAVAAAGAELPCDRLLDGKNMLPVLLGQSANPLHEALFWTRPNRPDAWAVRRGKWKLVFTGNALELYDLDADIGETTNLAGQNVVLVRELEHAYATWRNQMQ